MGNDLIQAQYEQLDAVASRFGNQAKAQTDLQNQLRRALQPLQQGGWQGRGSAAFFAEMNGKILPAMQRLAMALDQARAVTLEIKALIQEADRTASMPFQGSGATANSIDAAGGNTAGTLLNAISGAAALIGNIMKGVGVNSLLPLRYVLRSMTPNLARGQSTIAALMDMMKGKPGSGLWLIRFDGPHKNAPFPHINLNPKLTGFKDPHLPISPGLLDAAGKGARLLEGVNKVAVPVAIATDVFRLGAAFHNDGNQVGSQTKQTIGSVAGGWGGAWAGAEAGAAGGALLGGAIGSVVPVVGTAVGAGVGGFLGGLGGAIGGGLGGSWVGEKLGGLF